MKNAVVIDNKTVLNFFYDNRETFVVDFDEKKVNVEVENGTVYFTLKRKQVAKK